MSSFCKTVFLILINVQGPLFLHQHVIDVRTTCLANASRNLFLPSGGGEISSLIVYLSTKTIQPSCQFNVFSFLYDVGLVVVLDFLENQINCSEGEIIVKDDNETNVCKNIFDNLYRHEKIVKNVSVQFNFKKISNAQDIKLIFTAANLLSNKMSKCAEMGKITCLLGNDSLCIHKSLECNGDFNCGLRAKFDEDKEVCKAVGWKIWLVVICTILLLIFCNFTIFHFVKNNINTVPEYFYTVGDDKMASSRLNVPRVKISRNQEHHAIKLTNALYMEKIPVHNNLFENKKSSDMPLLTQSSTITPNTDWTASSNTSSKELEFMRSKKRNCPPHMKSQLTIQKSISQQMKQKLSSTTSESNPDGIKVTYYET